MKCKHNWKQYEPRFWNEATAWFYCNKCLKVIEVYKDKGLEGEE